LPSSKQLTVSGARRAKLPPFTPPQLATLVKEPPTGGEWLHELKFDGYRMLCYIDRGRATFWSRNGKDWTNKFQNVIKAIRSSVNATTAILDGEIVIVDAQGRSSFQKLQQSMGKGITSGFAYEVFDLIYLDGYSLTQTPLIKRKELLKTIIASDSRGVIRYSEHIQGRGDEFFKQACKHDIEGIVSKLADSTYEPTRTRSWLKVKCNKRQEFVIVGYVPSTKGMPGFGSLVIAVSEKGKYVYAGRVGTGFKVKQRLELQKQLDRISRTTSPLAQIPRGEPALRQAVWTEPKLIAEVAFTEWTSDGSIRPTRDSGTGNRAALIATNNKVFQLILTGKVRLEEFLKCRARNIQAENVDRT
jgi:bifunctional non-homologous end joining protein LigD